MKKKVKSKFTKRELLAIDKSAHRGVLKELGLLSVPTHKVHRDKKKYTRKKKHEKPNV